MKENKDTEKQIEDVMNSNVMIEYKSRAEQKGLTVKRVIKNKY